ncbi:MAG: transglycosylase SLT domain-containing protein [Tannerella sp.]|jgi:membrane-bound lytic murein transglycosylase D|nr:transglycosylase SLT domain-containing protein [Tannerella sp.]
MKKIILTLFASCTLFAAYAQEEVYEEEIEEMMEEEGENDPALSSDSIHAEIGMIPEMLDENVKNLLQSWHMQYFSNVEKYCLDEDRNVSFPEEIYRQRLAQMPCVIPMTYNRTVQECIDLYAGRRRGLMRYIMGMADVYFPVFEQILDEHQLPLELKYLAVVESALNPHALSRVGAAGLWQFMLPTAKVYGLEVNSLIDERLDPHKATHAACRYFKEMYELYGDWYFVLAAYNCGPGNVNKAIHRAGGKTDFWDIYPYLPRETRSYVPFFVAAAYVMTYHCEHNLCPIRTTLSVASDTLMINRLLHLRQVSEVLDVDFELLKMLNPQYKRDIIPGSIQPSVLKLPVPATYSFIHREDSVYLHRVEELLANCKPVDLSGEVEPNTRETIRHTVASGENMHLIANRYGVTARDIRKWNRLGSNRVAKGRQLTIHIDNGGLTYAAAAEKPPVKEDKKENKNVAVPATAVRTPKTQARPDAGNEGNTISYTVRSGDSLYSISKKYPGVTIAKIQSANRMKDSKLRIGQVLKIPVG